MKLNMKNDGSFFICILAFSSLFFPTTFNGQINSFFTVAFQTVFLLYFMLNIFIYKLNINLVMLPFSLLIIGSLLFYTLTTPLTEIRPGGIIYYISFAVIILMDLKKITLNPKNSFMFLRFMAGLIAFIGLAMVFDLFGINNLMSHYFAAYYQELYPYMIYGRKPVITFATQSVAGFILFLVLFLLQKTWATGQKKIDLFLIIIFYFLLYSLKSFTGLAFLGIGLVFLFLQSNKTQKFSLVVGMFMLLIYLFLSKNEMFFTLINNLVFVFNKQDNGLMGRYSDSGALAYNIDYIASSNFRPIGFSYREDLSFVDSGYIEYYLRGGIILLLSMLFGFIVFVKKNLFKLSDIIFIIAIFFLFELGFSGLVHPRVLYFIPFVLLYVRMIEAIQLRE